jgi:outer membrane receptor protein involved in Fe transport
MDIQADFYYNEVKDKIVAVPQTDPLVWTMLNLGYVEIRGMDISVNPHFRIGNVLLDGRLAYTYQRAQDFTPEDALQSGTLDSFHGDQIPYVPWHSGTVVLGAVWGEWNFNYSFIYTGERYMLGGNVPVNYIQPWYTHDLSVSRNIPLGRNTMRLTAEVNNIFNQQYEVVRCYPMPGTNFKLVVSFTF